MMMLPYITIKAGISLDGKVATNSGESKWITSEASRYDGRYLRHLNDAILVGIGTILSDNPLLDVRIPNTKNPTKIVLDNKLRTPINANIFKDKLSQTIIFVNQDVCDSKINLYYNYNNVIIKKIPLPSIDLRLVLKELYMMKISSVLVEGGSTIISNFIDSNIFDKLILYISPKLIGGNKTFYNGKGFSLLSEIPQLHIISIERIEQDIKIIATKSL